MRTPNPERATETEKRVVPNRWAPRVRRRASRASAGCRGLVPRGQPCRGRDVTQCAPPASTRTTTAQLGKTSRSKTTARTVLRASRKVNRSNSRARRSCRCSGSERAPDRFAGACRQMRAGRRRGQTATLLSRRGVTPYGRASRGRGPMSGCPSACRAHRRGGARPGSARSMRRRPARAPARGHRSPSAAPGGGCRRNSRRARSR